VIGSIEVDVAFLNDPANEKSDKVECPHRMAN